LIDVLLYQIVSGLTELSKAEESQVPIMNCYPRLLAAFLVQTASMAGAKVPKIEKVSQIILFYNISHRLCYILFSIILDP